MESGRISKRFLITQLTLTFVFLVFALSIIFNAEYITKLDNFIFNLLDYLRNDILNNIFLLITVSAGSIVIIIVLAFLWLLPSRLKFALPLSICVLSSSIINACFKLIICRTRPINQFVSNLLFNYNFPSSYSFPSGHSQTGLVFYFILTYLVLINLNIKSNKTKNIILLCSIIYSFLIGLSRIVLGVHFFSDILCGFIIGILIINTFILYYRKLSGSGAKPHLPATDVNSNEEVREIASKLH